jgi:hypothetical protein
MRQILPNKCMYLVITKALKIEWNVFWDMKILIVLRYFIY